MRILQDIEHNYRSLFGFNRKCQIEIIIWNEELDGTPVILAPGFLTEDSEDWFKYIRLHINAPIIYVKWRSSSVLKITTAVLTGLIGSYLTPTTGIIRSAGFMASLFHSWSSAAKEASLAGSDLAKILNDIWDEDDKAVFIGHSLGVRVITETMQKLEHDNVLTSISVAGAINQGEYDKRIQSIRTSRTINHSNLYSINDNILKWLYRVGEFNIKQLPIGLARSSLGNVKNYKNNIGHTEYHDENNHFDRKIKKLYKNAVDSLVENDKPLSKSMTL